MARLTLTIANDTILNSLKIDGGESVDPSREEGPMPDCIVCGAPTSAPMAVCDMCAQAAVEREMEPEPPPRPATDRELLERIAALVKKQQADIAKIRTSTGCLFAALLSTLILGLLLLLLRLH